MALILHRSDSPLVLADELAALLRAEPLDVFTPEVVVVGARGVERWLTQRLSHRLGTGQGEDGVSAGLEVHSPASLMALLLDRERDDPWHADRLVWLLLDALDACLNEPEFASVARHLGSGPQPDDPQERWERRARRSRRYAVARRVAGLFASYARERPQLLQAWEAGHAEDGTGQPLAADLTWQPVLWRATVALVIERGLADESPLDRHRRVVDGLRNGNVNLPALPARLSLFGHSRMAAAELELLDALSTRIDVHLWLPHPSPQLWNSLKSRTGVTPRLHDDSATAAQHPLLASLGRDVRELERSLISLNVLDTDVAAGPSAPATTRLELLQADIRNNVAPSATPVVDPADTSIQVHACHGAARQVEVLREVLVDLLDSSDGAIQPRDIIVMCPDIETFAPLIHATFGSEVAEEGASAQRHPGQRIRVQLADRGLGATNPLVDVAQRVIQLVSGRMSASDVLDLVAVPAVARRFGLDEDAVDLLTRWIAESGVRWGIDGRHRSEYGLAGVLANTWEAGLDRIALGVAVSADSRTSAGSFLPLDNVGSQNITTVSALLELLDILESAARWVRSADSTGVTGEMTVSAWLEWLRTTSLALSDIPESDRWQVAQFERELALISEAAGEDTRLRLTDVRVMIEQRWAARPTRSNFRTGAVTVCTMVPIRSVPHKVVIALGVDDGTYPRSAVIDGDDVLARNPLTGERDMRTEDSQLLLDAIMAAGEKFIALYSGFDERSGSRRPPAVPLQSVIAAAARTGVGETAEPSPSQAPFWHAQPLQAFDERNFTAASFLPGGTYDVHAQAGAEALRAARSQPQPRSLLVPEPLPPRTDSEVSLEDLVAFYENPAREFLRRRLEVTVPRAADEPEDTIPTTLEGLAKWKVGDRLLHSVLTGTPLPDAVAAERRRGDLPPGRLGEPVLTAIADEVLAIVEETHVTAHESLDVLLDLPSGIRVRGVVDDVADDTLEVLTYSTINPKHIVAAWVRLLGLAASKPDRAWRAVLRGKKRSVRLQAPEQQQAVRLLGELVEFREKGLRFPLGVPPKTASAYTTAFEGYLGRRPDAPKGAVRAGIDNAERVWASGLFPERKDDPWWARVYGENSTAADLNAWNSLTYWGPRIWSPIHAAGGRL